MEAIMFELTSYFYLLQVSKNNIPSNIAVKSNACGRGRNHVNNCIKLLRKCSDFFEIISTGDFCKQSSSSASKIVAEYKFEFVLPQVTCRSVILGSLFCTKMVFQVIGAAAGIGEDINRGILFNSGDHSWVRRALGQLFLWWSVVENYFILYLMLIRT